MTGPLTDRILLPVANEADVDRVCDALIERRVGEPGGSEIVVVHVIEKAGGAPDKAPLAAREEQAELIFERATGRLESAEYKVETRLLYATDVLEAIFDSARETNASSILFVPRPGGRITRFLSGDRSLRLVCDSPVPVIVLGAGSDE